LEIGWGEALSLFRVSTAFVQSVVVHSYVFSFIVSLILFTL